MSKHDDHQIGGAVRSTVALGNDLRVGDLIFIRVRAALFVQVAEATGSWTNHVGIAVGRDRRGPRIAESRFPWSGVTTLHRFISRSEGHRVSVARLRGGMTAHQQELLVRAASGRLGVLYDTGFNLQSRRQFCSRYVREVVAEGAGVELGEPETFANLLQSQPDAPLWFWKLWYFGQIPWHRQTITPAGLLKSPLLEIVFDGCTTHDESAETAGIASAQLTESGGRQ